MPLFALRVRPPETPSPMAWRIRKAGAADAEAIRRVYAHYVLNTISTLELQVPEVAEIEQRLRRHESDQLWLVCEDAGGAVRGYAYSWPFEEREGYRFTGETSIYLDQDHVGRGAGRQLYGALLDGLRERGVVTAIARIALPNARSQRLHEHFGFRKVGHFERIGFKFGRWVDIGYWQLTL